MERNIGEVFYYGSLRLRVEELGPKERCERCVFKYKDHCVGYNLHITGSCSRYNRADKKDVIFAIDKTSNQMKELNILARKAVVEHDDEYVHVNLELDCNDRLGILDDFKVDEIVNHIGIFNLLNNIDRASIVNYLKQTYSDEY